MRRRTPIVLVLAAIATAAWMLAPVCRPIANDALGEFNVPLEHRTDRDFYLKVFQQREGRWHQCKTRMSRIFFF
jgi:hypothetical protein